MSSAFAVDCEAGVAAHDRCGVAARLRTGVGEISAERVVDLAGDVALEAAHDFAFGLAFGGASLRVGSGARAEAQPADSDEMQSTVGLAVAAVVQAVAGRLAGGGWD